MKKNKALLDKTEHALHQHSMFTILLAALSGRRVRWCRWSPGCWICRSRNSWCRILSAACFWPPFYFLPGILAGAAIDIPADAKRPV
jgi:membrane protein DedA with SNARE-associated domain